MAQDAIKLSVAAVNSHRALRIAYVDVKGDNTERTIIPYRVVRASDGRTYTHAYCGLRHDKRAFRVDRIVSVVVGEKEVPDDMYRTLCPELLQHNVYGAIVAQVKVKGR